MPIVCISCSGQLGSPLDYSQASDNAQTIRRLAHVWELLIACLQSYRMKLSPADVSFWVVVLAVYAATWFFLRRWRKDVVYFGYIGLAAIGFFWRVLFAGAFVPAGGGDMAAILYPVYHFAQENLRQGVVPLWNPYLYAGILFVGHIQSGPFYPPHLLLFFAS